MAQLIAFVALAIFFVLALGLVFVTPKVAFEKGHFGLAAVSVWCTIAELFYYSTRDGIAIVVTCTLIQIWIWSRPEPVGQIP